MLFKTISEVGIEFAMLSGIPAYLLLQVWTLRHLDSGPRYAALLPVLLAFSVIAPCFDPTAGHGGPSSLAVLLFAPAAAVYLAGLALITRLLANLRDRLADPAPRHLCEDDIVNVEMALAA